MKQHHFHHNFHKKFHSYIYKWQNNLSIIRCNIATNRCNCNNVMLLFKDGWYIAIASLSFNSSKKIISHNNEIIRGRWMVAKKQMIVYWAVIALRYLTFFVVSVDKPTCPSVLTLIKFKYFIIFKCVKLQLLPGHFAMTSTYSLLSQEILPSSMMLSSSDILFSIATQLLAFI